MRESSRGWEWALGVWRRRKWLGAFVLALVGTATICIVTFLPDVYQSTATVLIDRPQVADVFVRPSVTGELDARLQTISQQILTHIPLPTTGNTTFAAAPNNFDEDQWLLRGDQQIGSRNRLTARWFRSFDPMPKYAP